MAETQALSVIQGNVLNLTIKVRQLRGRMPYPLAGMTLQMVVKASATDDDESGTTYEPTITNAAQGLATLSIPGSANTTPGTTWYRLDVIDSGSNHVTAAQGDYVVSAA